MRIPKLGVLLILTLPWCAASALADDPCETLHRASESNKADEVVRHLDAGNDVNCLARDGATPLISAVIGGSPTVIKVLLEHGADVNVPDDNGITALRFARAELARARRQEDARRVTILLLVVRQLLRGGATL